VTISRDDVDAASLRVNGRIRPVVVSHVETGAAGTYPLWLAHEYLQHTGSFKARGAANLAAFHVAAGSMPEAGVTIASGGNAGLACAWAAEATGTTATVFLPADAPPFKVSKLHGYGADVRLIAGEYADALAASIVFAEASGALLSHAYDNPQIAAGAGTLAVEMLDQLPDADTVVVAVGGGGLLAGLTAALTGTGVRMVGVEPRRCRALNAALEAGGPVDVTVDSVAADSLGARRVSRDAFELARDQDVTSVVVEDSDIVSARQWLWDERRIVVENGGATALAALLCGAYMPDPDEHVVAVLCGANTDPGDLLGGRF
jgi:threonine dehydratase